MLFVFLITSDTAKVRLEAIASTLSTFFWPIRLMFLMSVLADTAWPPCVHVESLSAREPPLSYFFGTPRNKVKVLAFTFCAVCFGLFSNKLFMTREEMATETFGSGTNSEAIVCSLLRSPGDIDT